MRPALRPWQILAMNFKFKIASAGFVLAVAGTMIVVAAVDEAKDKPPVSFASQANNEADTLDRWRKLARSGKGVFAAKLKQDFRVRVALFAGTNRGLSASEAAKYATVWFDSVDQVCDFLRATKTGINLGDGGHGLADDAGILQPFTDAEKQKLRMGDPLRDPVSMAHPNAVRGRKVDFPLFNWVRLGTLYWLDDQRIGVFQYRTSDGVMSVVSGDPVKVQAIFQEEFNDDRQMREFVDSRLPHVALYFFGKREACIITRSYLERRAAVSQERWPAGAQPEELRASEALLQKYVIDGSPVRMITEMNGWTLTMPVTNGDGSIERWEMDGTICPITITTMRQTVCEMSGSVVPLPLPLRIEPK
jgi:hypothetical protein